MPPPLAAAVDAGAGGLAGGPFEPAARAVPAEGEVTAGVARMVPSARGISPAAGVRAAASVPRLPELIVGDEGASRAVGNSGFQRRNQGNVSILLEFH